MSNARIVNQIEDLTLGVFSNLRPSETLDHLVRYLSTWNGSECVIFFFLVTAKQISLSLCSQQVIHGKGNHVSRTSPEILNDFKVYSVLGKGVSSYLASKSTSPTPHGPAQ